MYVYVYACEKINKYRRASKTSAYAHPLMWQQLLSWLDPRRDRPQAQVLGESHVDTCWLNPIAIALGFPAVPVKAVMILELCKVHVVASLTRWCLCCHIPTMPYGPLLPTSSCDEIKRCQGRTLWNCLRGSVLFKCVWKWGMPLAEKGYQASAKANCDPWRLLKPVVLSHTEMDTLEALANKSQITGPQYDDVD